MEDEPGSALSAGPCIFCLIDSLGLNATRLSGKSSTSPPPPLLAKRGIPDEPILGEGSCFHDALLLPSDTPPVLVGNSLLREWSKTISFPPPPCCWRLVSGPLAHCTVSSLPLEERFFRALPRTSFSLSPVKALPRRSIEVLFQVFHSFPPPRCFAGPLFFNLLRYT